MADYSVTELVEAAKGAGFDGAGLVTSVAVSLAEDGRRELRAVNVNVDGSRDRGPWQINDRAHPDVDDACAFNLDCAAAAAFRISSSGNSFQPWTTWVSGAYKQHLAEVQALVGGGQDPTAQQQSADPTGLTAGIPAAVKQVLGAGQVAGGALLVVAGLGLAVLLVARRG